VRRTGSPTRPGLDRACCREAVRSSAGGAGWGARWGWWWGVGVSKNAFSCYVAQPALPLQRSEPPHLARGFVDPKVDLGITRGSYRVLQRL
jgi:hypothetical protein